MQAYHHQITNLNLPNGTSSLLIATPSQIANMQQQQQQQQQQHHHQHQPTSYQDLVKTYLPQLNTVSATGLASLSTSPLSSSPSSLSSSSTSSMASFAVKLMSLNAHELRCLNSDNELMRHIHEAQVLIDNRLHDINSTKSGTDSNLTRHGKQQLHHQHSSPNSSNLSVIQQQQQQQQQQQHQEQQIQLQQQHLLMSSENYYQNYYQQLALSQMAQLQHQQQQQLLLMDPGYNFGNKSANNYHTLSSIEPRNGGGSKMNNLTPQQTATLNHEESCSNLDRTGNNQQQQVFVPALDLRTTPTRPMSDTPSPKAAESRPECTTECSRNSRQHPKKAKLTEYRKMQQTTTERKGDGESQAACSMSDHKQHLNNLTQYQDISASKTSTTLVSNENFQNQTEPKRLQQLPLQNENKIKQESEQHRDLITLNSNIANTRSSRFQTNSSSTNKTSAQGDSIAPAPVTKKHKGEFDEPGPAEVSQRERQLSRPDHYHRRALELGECACIIGSEFTTKTPRQALEQLDQWRTLDIEERIKWKWDLNDLPKDIPLSDIKKFEDLRRDFSNGRADFGGASKRKPLGIRGTRQFLLMLYCLWGHPGRDDPMQQDGYCPHCFAKIRTENEQSTLVRVVNHFNMKHRRGANPRLSPETRASTTPQDHLICETLKSVVETAIASTEEDQPAKGKS